MEKNMLDLLANLSKINFEELARDDFLDQRDSDPFDLEWVRVYRALDELKKGKVLDDAREVGKKSISQFTEKRRTMNWQGASLMTLV